VITAELEDIEKANVELATVLLLGRPAS